ncbi:MAG: histidine kinase, partial [Myxococcota bacterium]
MTERTRFFLLGSSILTVFTLVHAVALSIQQSVPFAAALFGAFIYYGLLMLLANPLWRVCAALAHRKVPWGWAVTAHTTLLLIAVSTWMGSYIGLLYLSAGAEVVRTTLNEGGTWIFLQSLTNYTMLVAGIVSHQSQQRLNMQRRRESELRALAQQAELRALRAQLRPHFIFNVLNSIYALIPVSPDKAQTMVEKVADLIRDTLEVTDQKLIPLEQELALVDRYLNIEALRVGDRLHFEKDISLESVRWPVPPLILQPLVENAIKHGIGRMAKPGYIRIQTQTCPQALKIQIINSGPKTMRHGSRGKGLSITENRLETMYGEG